jgi:hypothetical protein
VRGRGCLLAAAVVLAVTAAAAAVVGPGLLRRARDVYAPLSRMKGEQRDFEAWTHQRAWRDPPSPVLSADELERFLDLRRELRGLDQRATAMRRRGPEGEPPRLEDVPTIVEGVGGLVTERLAAFRHHDITPAQYDYVERLVYGSWLRSLQEAGEDPAARDRAAREVEEAARREGVPAVQARLRQVAADLRARVPAAPAGVPEDVHRLLLAHAAAIAAQPATRIGARVPRVREGVRGQPSPAS